jgi:hypothetical protein
MDVFKVLISAWYYMYVTMIHNNTSFFKPPNPGLQPPTPTSLNGRRAALSRMELKNMKPL